MANDREPQYAASDLWAALSAHPDGAIPDGDLDPETARVLRHLHRLTQSPPPAGASDRVDRDIERRRSALQNGNLQQEILGMNVPQTLALPAPNVGPWGRVPSAGTMPSPRSHRSVRWFAPRVTAAVLALVLGIGYLAVDPFGGTSDRPVSLPAVVVPAATPDASPTATYLPTFDHVFSGVWYWNLQPGSADCCNAAIAYADGRYIAYDPFPGVGIGTWRATGERTVEISLTHQRIDEHDMFDPEQVTLGTEFQPGMEVWTASVTIDEAGSTASLTAHWDALNGEGAVVHSEDTAFTGTRMVPDPTAATPTSTQ